MAERLRVLCVEDSDDDAALVLRAVRQGGYDLLSARVETESEMRAALAREPWDLIIADFSMPHFSAPAALTVIKDVGLDVPFIIVSGTIADDTAVAAMRAGAHDYVFKGNLARLVPAIRRELHEAAERDLRRRAERALTRSEVYLRAVVEDVPDGLVTLDETGKIELFNPAAERIFGYTSADIVGQAFDRLLAEGAGELLAVNESGRMSREVRARRKDGTVFPLDLALSATRLDERAVVIAILRDISERKATEAERERLLAAEQAARAEAEAANQAKDEFLSILSHELRTPLTPMLLWLRMMRTKKLDEASLACAVDVVERNTQLQVRLVEDILDLSRIITGKFHLDVRTVRLSEIIQSAIDSARPSAELKGVRLDAVFPSGADTISGERPRLQQVVWNLIANAIKFTPKGGRVAVRLEREAGCARITVSDTGKGISADFLPHVFDRFRQADSSSTREHGGLGLGLAIVRHLVELHGGTVRAESPGDGLGATFTVSLPAGDSGVQPEAGAVERPGDDVDRVSSLEGVRVLVVDDDPDTREALRTVLEHCHADVVTAASSAEAIAAMDRSSPDVLLCDIGMPDEDGYALLRKVRARGPERGGQTPAVALTAYALDDDRRGALLAGFQAHLAKPADPADLTAVVAALARRGASRDLASARDVR